MSDIEEIRRQMALIRRDLHQDVSGVVEKAADAMDWRSYIRSAPWVSVGLGFALGYWIVPRPGRSQPPLIVAPQSLLGGDGHLPARFPTPAPERKAEPPRKRSSWGLLRKALEIAWPIAVNAGQAYASHLVEDFLSQNRPAGFPDGSPSGFPGPSKGPGYGPDGPGVRGRNTNFMGR